MPNNEEKKGQWFYERNKTLRERVVPDLEWMRKSTDHVPISSRPLPQKLLCSLSTQADADR